LPISRRSQAHCLALSSCARDLTSDIERGRGMRASGATKVRCTIAGSAVHMRSPSGSQPAIRGARLLRLSDRGREGAIAPTPRALNNGAGTRTRQRTYRASIRGAKRNAESESSRKGARLREVSRIAAHSRSLTLGRAPQRSPGGCSGIAGCGAGRASGRPIRVR
jgi:hypothetical protein